MNPIEARDKEVRRQELLSVNSFATALLASLLILWLTFATKFLPFGVFPFVLLMITWGYWYIAALKRIKDRVFDHKGYELLWSNIVDREARFKKVLLSVQSYRPDDFESLKDTVEYTSKIVFQALKRADLINTEIGKTERSLVPANTMGPSNRKVLHQDEEVQLLYRTADKNIAEYKNKMEALEQGMQRSEGQAAVYATMLDTLRVQLIGHKLLGKPTTYETGHFMEVIEDAKAQLRSVDEALEELDFESLARAQSEEITIKPLANYDNIEPAESDNYDSYNFDTYQVNQGNNSEENTERQ